jgi:hypothetical protein
VAISEIDKYALKAYELLHGETSNLGDISKIEKLPIADMWTYSFQCFVGDSLVLPADGYKEIKLINVGDFVLLHDNKYHKVTKIMDKGEKNIFILKGMAIDGIRTTSNYKFLARKMSKENGKRVFSNPKWIEAKDLVKGGSYADSGLTGRKIICDT